jgi:hypothetical protein
VSRSTFNAAREAIEVIMVCNLMAKVGLEVEDAASAQAALNFGAKILSFALKKEVTPAAFRKRLDRVMKIYRGDPEAARMLNRVSASLAEWTGPKH